MKKILVIFLLIFVWQFSFAQTGAVLQTKYGLDFNDLQNVLYFEGIGLEKFNFKSERLNGKDFQILIKELKNGKITRIDTVFNSREDEYFRIKGDSLVFTVLSRMTDMNYFKVLFQFDGFSVDRKYPVLPSERDKFTMKGFCGNRAEMPIDLNETTYFLTYMMPYVRPDKSTAYCEVAQSGIDPEKLYNNYKIPHYFLIAIRFQ